MHEVVTSIIFNKMNIKEKRNWEINIYFGKGGYGCCLDSLISLYAMYSSQDRYRLQRDTRSVRPTTFRFTGVFWDWWSMNLDADQTDSRPHCTVQHDRRYEFIPTAWNKTKFNVTESKGIALIQAINTCRQLNQSN
jgi:hypothetical protein